MARSPAKWRYELRVIALTAVYGAGLILATWLFKHHLVAGPLAWIVALLPALPIVGIFAVIGVYLVEETDEYVRMLFVRQTLWGSGFALSIATVWGFFQGFGLVGPAPAYDVVILWYAGLGLGALANGLTSRRGA
jgi:hypothetical protein